MTYQQTYVLHFGGRAAAQKAHALTGWPFWDDHALEPTFHDDMLKTTAICSDGPAMFFGDYELHATPA